MTTWWWLSSERVTIAVEVDEFAVVVSTPPIARRFRGKPMRWLNRWLRAQGGLRWQRLDG